MVANHLINRRLIEATELSSNDDIIPTLAQIASEALAYIYFPVWSSGGSQEYVLMRTSIRGTHSCVLAFSTHHECGLLPWLFLIPTARGWECSVLAGHGRHPGCVQVAYDREERSATSNEQHNDLGWMFITVLRNNSTVPPLPHPLTLANILVHTVTPP